MPVYSRLLEFASASSLHFGVAPSSVANFRSLFVLVVSSYLTYRLVRRYLTGAQARAHLARVHAIKRAARNADMAILDAALVHTVGERAQHEPTIVTAEATTLVAQMADGTHSATLVVHAILNRLVAAHTQFNVLAETNFKQALEDAEKADKQYVATSMRTPCAGLEVRDGARIIADALAHFRTVYDIRSLLRTLSLSQVCLRAVVRSVDCTVCRSR
jgi:hypothetical protein